MQSAGPVPLVVSLICLLAALVLSWGRPARTLKRQSAGSLTIDLECDAEPALAELRKVSAALERIAKQQESVIPALRLEVKEQEPERPKRGEPVVPRPAAKTAKRRGR